MKKLFLFLTCSISLFCENKDDNIFHKTVGQIEVYKNKGTLNLRSGCVRRLTKNLLTPIHNRKSVISTKAEQHLQSKNKKGPVTVKFLLPTSIKQEVLKLLAKNKLVLSIPFSGNKAIKTKNLEIDRHANPPAGLFAMKSSLESHLLNPAEVIFIHLLKGDI